MSAPGQTSEHSSQGFAAIAWDDLRARNQEIGQKLMDCDLELSERIKIQKEGARLTDLLASYDALCSVEREVQDVQAQMSESEDTELRELFELELEELLEKQKESYLALDLFLYPPDVIDNRSVFLEIRSGAGGKEAALFAGDLLRMYSLYAQRMGWRASVSDASETDLGGYREVILHIEGKNAYGYLKFESGVHRVQRVPETETAGRVHTSTATVAVLPEAKEVDVQINPSDLRIDVFRATGAGGQHVNTTDSAVRITHIPTGVVSTCQDERSQHKNKAKALKILQSRILLAQREKEAAEQSKQRKEQVGAGARAEKVRTYNYPQNRVSDHQVNVTLKKLDIVMTGELDEIIDALVRKEREDRRSRALTA
jgi:peptide chain release factor 1